MRKHRKLIVGMLGALMLGALSACSGGNNQETSAVGDTADSQEVVELSFWYQDNQLMMPYVQQRVDEFNVEYEGTYHLSVEFIPRGSGYAYEDKVNSAASANILPDILSTDGPNISNYAANGIIMPITEYITEESKEDMMPSMVLQNTYENDMYAIGLNEATCLFFYNKDIFDEHGFRIPESIDDAYTWTEVYDMAKEVATPEMAGIKIVMNKGEGIPYGLTPLWISAGAPLTSEDGSVCQGYVNSEKSIETATYLQRFFTEKLANIDPTPTEFQDGKAAMWIAANVGEISGFEKNFPDLNWGATYLPRYDTGEVSAPCGSWAAGISRNCENPDAAFIALDWLTNAESTRLYSDNAGYPAARKSSYENNEKWSTYPFNMATEQLFEAAVPRPKTPIYTVFSPKFSETMIDIFTGADPKTSLDALAEYVDAEYGRFQNSLGK